MQSESKNVYSSIVDDKSKTMLYLENGKFYSRENSLTIEEYSKKSKTPIYEKIKSLKEFESDNQSFLSSDEGKKEYSLYKNIMKGGKSINTSDGLNSPYEDFIN